MHQGRGIYFQPAWCQMLLRRNWFNTSLSLPLTVTVPGLEGCLNCRWSPLVLTNVHPSFLSICKTSLTLYFFISLNVLIATTKVRFLISFHKKIRDKKVLKAIPFTTDCPCEISFKQGKTRLDFTEISLNEKEGAAKERRALFILIRFNAVG